MKIELINAPTVEPVTTAEQMAHSRVINADEESYLAGLITAARSKFEIESEHFVADAEYAISYTQAEFKKRLVLPLHPVQSVVSITTDNDGTLTEDTDYSVTIDPFSGWCEITFNVDAQNITVDFLIGYPSTGDETPVSTAPELIKLAIKSLVDLWYKSRASHDDGAFNLKAVPGLFQSTVIMYRQK